MATSAATIAAAIVARARREVREHFEARNAYGPEGAVGYEPPDHVHERQFELLIGRGILRSTGDGRHWLDREAIRREEQRRQAAAKKVLVIIAVGIVIALVIAAVMLAIAAEG